MTDAPYRKRDRDWTPYDEITFVVVPRFKTSGLSGDEWRTSVQVTWKFKGVVTFQKSYSDMQTAHLMYTGDYLHAHWAVPLAVIEVEKWACDEPGCSQKAAGRFQLKRETAPDGSWLDPKELYGMHFRQFCMTHVERGDCSREDADDNYIPLDKVGPADSQNNEESPSAFGGVIDLTQEAHGD